MLRIVFAALFVSVAGTAEAACVCRCVAGTMQAVCARPTDRPVICRPGICRTAVPPIRQLDRRPYPPLGPRYCDLTSPDARRYGLKGRCP